MQKRKNNAFKLGDRIYCNKHNLNGYIYVYNSGLFTVIYENGKYGRYKPEAMTDRFVLFEPAKSYKNVIYVDFKNKRVG